MRYSIRKARLEDAAALAAVERACFPEAEAATLETISERLRTYPESFFLAETEETLIGFINGFVTDSRVITDAFFEDAALHNPLGGYQCVFGLDVDPAYRGQGVAAVLMRRMIDVTRDHGRKGLILTCKEPLIGYYEAFGFKNLGISGSVHGGAVWYDMILEFQNVK